MLDESEQPFVWDLQSVVPAPVQPKIEDYGRAANRAVPDGMAASNWLDQNICIVHQSLKHTCRAQQARVATPCVCSSVANA